MSYQFSIWLDEKTANDLDLLSRLEERKRGSMIKVLIRRAAKELAQSNITNNTQSTQNKALKSKRGGMNVAG